MSCCDKKEYDSVPVQSVPASGEPNSNHKEAVFLIQKMDCPTEEKLIRDRFQNMPGIVGMQFNLMRRELTLQHQLPSIEPIITALSALGLEPKTKSDSLNLSSNPTDEHSDAEHYRISKSQWLLMAISGITALSAEAVAWTTGKENSWPVIILALIAILTGGMDTLKKGWIALRNFSLNMNFLMSIAVIGAIFIRQWPEAAMVIFLFALAEMIEALSLDRARNAIQGLMAMSPETATIQTDNSDWHEVPAKEVALNAIVRIKPGERVPLDGLITNGQTTINQAPITGESMPVEKKVGDPVFAGTINEQGAFDYCVTAVQSHSMLSRIIKSVQQAQGDRAPTQRFVDRFAQYYIPAVVAVAFLIALIPPLLMGATFQPWFYKALVLLVIACPCALVISTPATIVSGLASAARSGILIKGGVYLEQGRLLKVLALDKTGTITVGKPQVTNFELVSEADETTLLRQAASLSARSDHPVSTAIAKFWKEQNTSGTLLEVEDFEALTGKGIKGVIEGKTYFLGNHRLVHEKNICGSELEQKLEIFEKEGKTVVILCSTEAPLLILCVADTIRETSIEAIAKIKQLGIDVVMLTGDNSHTAQAIANKVGIKDARGNLLPDDKLKVITDLIAKHGYAGMVGDGINDAPALAKASIGFAMGAAGTDTALETADVALMNDDLRKIPEFLHLSARTRSVLIQNITLALGIKIIFLVLALTGHATLWMAVFADMGASLIVVFNGLRLLKPLSKH